MSWVDDFDAWSDRLNPAVVKDLRQGLRTRGFWLSFALMLLGCVTISATIYVTSRRGLVNGAGALVSYLAAVTVVEFFILPFSGYLSLQRERKDGHWGLITLSGLGTRRLLHGKLLALLLQAMLYASAAVPFLLFCYYLNGVDLLTLVAVLVLGCAWSVLLLASGLFTAAMAFGGGQDRAVDALTGFLTLGGLVIGAPMGFGVVFGISRLLAAHPGSFVPGLLAWTWGIVGLGLLVLELAVDLLARANEQDARSGKYLGPMLMLSSSAAGFIVWLAVRS